jgi:hypothetical protein
MKMIFGMCAMILLGAIGYVVWNSQRIEHHGQPFKGLQNVALTELIDKPDAYVSKPVRVQGVVHTQCQMSGCWFFLKSSGEKELKIEMGDTTPTLPKSIGKTATVEGALVKSGETYEFIGNAVEFK